jgi:heme-degrading monooxygenase HmoA
MIQQQGCTSEKLLRSKAGGEFISYSEWESEKDIERYMNSDAHKEIVRHSSGEAIRSGQIARDRAQRRVFRRDVTSLDSNCSNSILSR